MKNKKLEMELTRMVKKNPVLYNQLHPGFRDMQTKSEIWTKIGNELQIDGISAMKKWKNMRDKYVRQGRNKRPNHKDNFRHYLTFLDEHIKIRLIRRKAATQRIKVQDNIETRNSSNNKTDENLNDEETSSDDNTNFKKEIFGSEKSVEVNEDITLVANDAILENNPLQLTTFEANNDVDVAFCKYLLTEMTNMTQTKKNKLKSIVMATILETELV